MRLVRSIYIKRRSLYINKQSFFLHVRWVLSAAHCSQTLFCCTFDWTVIMSFKLADVSNSFTQSINYLMDYDLPLQSDELVYPICSFIFRWSLSYSLTVTQKMCLFRDQHLSKRLFFHNQFSVSAFRLVRSSTIAWLVPFITFRRVITLSRTDRFRNRARIIPLLLLPMTWFL